LPEEGAGNPRYYLVFEHAPDTPPRAYTLAIEPPPAVPQMTPHAPLQHQRIEQFPMKPALCQRAVGFRPQRVHIQHTFPAFYGDFHLPTTPVQGEDRLGGKYDRRQCGKNQYPACQKKALSARRAFFIALPAFVPGTIVLLHVQTIGMHPASYL